MNSAPVRWTEHGPEPVSAEPDVVEPAVVGEAPADGAEGEIAALRARLAERGLVRQEPSVRIRDLAGDAPTRPVAEPAEAAVRVAVPDDAEELEAEPPGPSSEVRCPSCRSAQQVAVGASGYRCASCAKTWRWAICTHCAELSLTLARQESWRCTPCGDYSRSWWRTVDGRREAPTVVMRRQADEVRRQRLAAQERARKRRWKVVAAGALLIAGTSAWAVGASDRAMPVTERGATGRVCTMAGELRSTFASGATRAADVRASLDALAVAANDAIPDVGLAAQRWAASGQPGDETFEAAAQELATACAAE